MQLFALFQPYLENSTILEFFLRLIALTDGEACPSRLLVHLSNSEPYIRALYFLCDRVQKKN